MLNFDQLQENFAADVNTVSANLNVREVSTADLQAALIGEACEYMASYSPAEDAGASALIASKLAKQAGEAADFGEFISAKILGLFERKKAALAAENADAVASAETASQGLATFIKRVQSSVGRSSYYRQREAERLETPAADANGREYQGMRPVPVRTDYDGFQRLYFTPDQVTDAVDELFPQLEKAYTFALSMCDSYIQKRMGDFPFSSVKVGAEYRDFMTRGELFQHLGSVTAARQGSVDEAVAMI